MSKRLFGLALIVGMLIVCTNINLEKKLAPKVKEWLEIHAILMQYPVPAEVDPKKPSEYSYFLHLSPALQLKYIQYFWDIRDQYSDPKEGFYARFGYASRVFQHGVAGWRTDRGQLLLLIGEPNAVDFYSSSGMDSGSSASSTEFMAEGDVQRWIYWFRGQLVAWYFVKHANGEWYNYSRIGLEYTQGQTTLMLWAQWFQAPTEEGWMKWREVLSGQLQTENAPEAKKLLKKMKFGKGLIK